MKCLRRCLCVLLCLVSLSGVFSVSVSAVEVDTPYKVNVSAYMLLVTSSGNRWHTYGSFSFVPNNGEIETSSGILNLYNSEFEQSSDIRNVLDVEVENIDGSVLSTKGKETTFKLQNIYYSYLMDGPGESDYYYMTQPEEVYLELFYVDGSTEVFGPYNYDKIPNKFNVNIESVVTPSKDVSKVRWSFYQDIPTHGWFNSTDRIPICAYLGEYDGDSKYTYSFDQTSKEVTLLGGIWDSLTSGFSALGEKLSGVWSAITDGFTNMGNKLTQVWTSITDGFKDMGNKLTSLLDSILELPRKLWGLIEDGLKSLFIPSAESFQDLKANFDLLLEEKLGALYQVGSIIVDFWQNILLADERNAIDIPEVQIPIGSEKTFTFGGYSVVIVPDGFGPVALTAKLITSIVATFAFMNALKKKYEQLLHT